MKFVFLFMLVSLFIYAEAGAMTILLDPGHGGEEDGATVANVKEKNLSLAIAKKIQEKLSKHYAVYLTRSLDRTVTLPERASIAEKIKADLFISIHINSSPDGMASGFETYYLDNHNDVAIKKVEKTENVMLKNDEQTVQQILIDLVVEQTVKTSKPLAESIHSAIRSSVGRKYHLTSRGVRPGLFYVLALSKRPGVLLEVGFISTPKERARMMKEKFQEDYAAAVVRGIEKYIHSSRPRKTRSKKSTGRN
jgi:N-acetylmuramoyl-L-alanine amidase